MQKKDFVFNVGLLIFLNLLIKPFWILGIDVGVQNSVGASQYGLYFAVFNFTFLFNMILDMGITNFNNRNIARHNQLLQNIFPDFNVKVIAWLNIYCCYFACSTVNRL